MSKEQIVMRTAGKSKLNTDEFDEFDDLGCGEGYEWWLRHNWLLTSPSAEEGNRDYPPPGEWYKHISEYHTWLDA